MLYGPLRASFFSRLRLSDLIMPFLRGLSFENVRFTYVGLAPAIECYGGCSGAWGFYVNDGLRSLITTGKGHPNSNG